MQKKVCSAVELRFNLGKYDNGTLERNEGKINGDWESYVLGSVCVYEGEYYFKKMRVKLAQWSGKVQ